MALENPVVKALIPIDARAYVPACSGFLSQTYSCSTQPGMISVASSMPACYVMLARPSDAHLFDLFCPEHKNVSQNWNARNSIKGCFAPFYHSTPQPSYSLLPAVQGTASVRSPFQRGFGLFCREPKKSTHHFCKLRTLATR